LVIFIFILLKINETLDTYITIVISLITYRSSFFDKNEQTGKNVKDVTEREI